jgi:hypothetical protein
MAWGAGAERPAGFRYWRRIMLGSDRDPPRTTGTRRDGSLVDIGRSLGLGPRRAPDPMADDAPGWRNAWP